MKRYTTGCAALTIAALLAGCASDDLAISSDTRREDVRGRPLSPLAPEETFLGGGDGLLSIGGDDQPTGGAQLPVNKYLWRATLDTLAFLPLASTDPYGGVIVTDWGATADAPNERFKVTAYITSAQLKPQSLRVIVNRQAREANGEWVTASVDPETPRKLENAILTRARVIKTGEAQTQ